MSSMVASTEPTVAAVARAPAVTWRLLAIAAGVVSAVGHLLIAAAYRDVESLAVALAVIVAVALVRVRRGTVGLAILAVLGANVVLWTLPATVVNVREQAGAAAIALPGSMAVVALIATVSAVVALLARGRSARPLRGAVVAAAAGVVGLVAVAAAALAAPTAPVAARPGDHPIVADRTAFSATELEVRAGTVSVHLENRDYFWHTFTIAELGVDLRVPVEGAGRATFEAPPGSYTFICAIPGHDVAGMVGTLEVTR